MHKKVVRKGLVVGIIVLFIGGSVLGVSSKIETNKTIDEIVNSELADGLVGYWSFDEGSGSTIADGSGNGNDGTVHGATWIDGISGSALGFDGIDDYVDIDDVSDFEFVDQSITFTIWVQIVDNVNKYRCFMSLGDTVDNYPHFGILKSRSDGNDGRLYTETYGTSDKNRAYSNDDGETLPKNEWLFLASVIDYTNSIIKLYVNGIFQDSDDFVSYDMSDAESLGLIMGKNLWPDPDWPAYLYGCIDEVRIYDRALDEDEIQELYYTPFKTSVIVGKITNLNTGTGDRITFNAVKIRCIQISPFKFIRYTSDEEIMALDNYFGIVTPNFIFGFFKAVI